jgi:hypothetical protein
LKKAVLFYCIFNMHPTDHPPPDQRVYEGWYAFTGAHAPPVAVVRSCAPVEDAPEVQAGKYQMFCDRAGAYIKPKLSWRSGWFCIRASGSQDHCNELITANTERRRIIRWEMW